MSISSITIDTLRPSPTGMALRNVQSPATGVELQAGDFWQASGDDRWKMIVCLRGMVWITQERDFRDYVLEAGDMFLITQSGVVLMQALEDARVEITPCLKTRPYKGKCAVFP